MVGSLEADIHAAVHLLKGALGLCEEVVDDALTEVSLIFIVVHLENLFKGGRVDNVAVERG